MTFHSFVQWQLTSWTGRAARPTELPGARELYTACCHAPSEAAATVLLHMAGGAMDFVTSHGDHVLSRSVSALSSVGRAQERRKAGRSKGGGASAGTT
ncbi:hypothetical protein SLUN_02170 [Streptomyces lunaelactis]|uniref:Uncharacterized protein n=1 Tax=Streptomyces lunaelactis TaxID=1535768 RepID=A0A2R4SWH1_9ACTN|nr:hypothetical protein SLUN_02170 [Streptomyces lunaelactis]